MIEFTDLLKPNQTCLSMQLKCLQDSHKGHVRLSGTGGSTDQQIIVGSIGHGVYKTLHPIQVLIALKARPQILRKIVTYTPKLHMILAIAFCKRDRI